VAFQSNDGIGMLQGGGENGKGPGIGGDVLFGPWSSERGYGLLYLMVTDIHMGACCCKTELDWWVGGLTISAAFMISWSKYPSHFLYVGA
jgi:hypothetical protein